MLKLVLSLVVVSYYFIFPLPAYAGDEVSFNLFSLLIGLFGGLALFLFGLEQLSGGWLCHCRCNESATVSWSDYGCKYWIYRHRATAGI